MCSLVLFSLKNTLKTTNSEMGGPYVIECERGSSMRSSIISAIEPIIGFEVESLSNKEINNLSKGELGRVDDRACSDVPEHQV
jgi:hypothetical protein